MPTRLHRSRAHADDAHPVSSAAAPRSPRRVRALSSGAAVLVAAALVTGCSSGQTTTASEPSAAGWPLTVTVGTDQVTIPSAPQHIVAVSTETSDIVLQLVGASRVTAINPTVLTMGSPVAKSEGAKVATKLPATQSPNAEALLALGPDLVVMTGRSTDEKSVVDVLHTAGVELLAFPNEAFTSPDAVMTTVTTLGQALGEQETAAGIVAGMKTSLDATKAKVAGATGSPRTLSLMARGDRIMVLPSTEMGNALITLAGGTSVAAEAGVKGGVVADVETIITMKPDAIVLEDFRGIGSAPFDALLANPSLADVPAVKNHRIELVSSGVGSSAAGTRSVEGLDQIARFLHPELY